MIAELNYYEKIMCIALSSEDVNIRIVELQKYLNKIDNKILHELASVDEMDSHIAWLMNEAEIELDSSWNTSLINVKKRITNLMNELEMVACSLLKEGIKIIALKNAGITKGIYQNVACSPMGDVDLLVSTSDFHKAHNILINTLGFNFKFRSEFEKENIDEAFKSGGTEYFKEVNGYIVWLELQWRPVAGRWIQPHSEPSGEELIKNSLAIPGSCVRILAPEHNLLQVCLHTAKHSYFRAPGFRLHSDVDRIVRHTNLDWEKFKQIVVDLKVKTPVYFSLSIPKYLLDTPIPNDVIQYFKPNIFKEKLILYFLRKAGIFNQRKKKFSRLGYMIFIVLLFDTIFDLITAIFPPMNVMRKKYGFKSFFSLPYFYLIRLSDLAARREKL